MNDAGHLYRPSGMLCATGLDLAREARRLACVAPIRRSNPIPSPRIGDQANPSDRAHERRGGEEAYRSATYPVAPLNGISSNDSVATNIEYEPKRNPGNLTLSSAVARAGLFREVDRPRYPAKSDCIKQTQRAHNEAHIATGNQQYRPEPRAWLARLAIVQSLLLSGSSAIRVAIKSRSKPMEEET